MDRLADILAHLAGKTVLVVGMARSGRSASLALVGRGARVIGTDRRASLPEADELARAGVRLELGADRPDLIAGADLVILSPGVAGDSPMARAAREADTALIGELELAQRLAGVATLAVTGTNGKSTTTALCAHLLERAGLRVFLGGNIGRPLSELLLGHQPVDWAVVEVSSFQLEHLTSPRAFVPQVAIWLNLTPDHLDRHGSLEAYTATKRRLFEGQSAEHTGVFFLDDDRVRMAVDGLSCRKRWFARRADRVAAEDARVADRTIVVGSRTLQLPNPRLAGDHNTENAAAAVLAVSAAGVGLEHLQAGLDDFAGLPHRMEPVRELDGVRWINDSKGTNPDATAKSLTSFDAPIVLIAGGRGKGVGYRQLRDGVSGRVSNLVLIGEDADRLAADLRGCAPVHRASDLAQAVDLARSLAAPGGVVLLSPACASFDMFDDYAHRGQVFCELVRALGEGK